MFYTVIEPAILPDYLHLYAQTIPYSYYSTSTALPIMTQTDLRLF